MQAVYHPLKVAGGDGGGCRVRAVADAAYWWRRKACKEGGGCSGRVAADGV
jgi:hypothetical protein